MSPFQSFSLSSEKFQHIHVDIVEPLPESCGCSYLLTITDRFSQWVEALPLTDITAKSCADRLYYTLSLNMAHPTQLQQTGGDNSLHNCQKT